MCAVTMVLLQVIKQDINLCAGSVIASHTSISWFAGVRGMPPDLASLILWVEPWFTIMSDVNQMELMEGTLKSIDSDTLVLAKISSDYQGSQISGQLM